MKTKISDMNHWIRQASKTTFATLLYLILINVDVSAQATKSIKVLSYNVHHCNPPSKEGLIDIKAIAKVIIASNADLVALQEVDVNTIRSGKGIHQARELGRLTGMQAYFTKTIDHEGGDYGVAVLSKLPILDSASYKLPMKEGSGGEPRGMSVIKVKVPDGKELLFASTHFDLKEANRSLQAEEIKRIFSDQDLPVVLAGDLNAVPESAPISTLNKVFKSTCPDQCPFTIPVTNPSRTIDYIMLRKPDQFQVVSHKVINETYASDHLPVLAEIMLIK